MKHIPKFSGTSAENFDTWVLNTKLYLNHFKNTSPEDKKDALLFRIEGYARQIIEQAISSGIGNDFTTPEEILTCLAKTYGEDPRALQCTLQLPQESVKIYLSRLRTNLSIIGCVESTQVLDHFVKGLLPNISQRV